MTQRIHLDNEWLDDLSAKYKGQLGEDIVRTHLHSAISNEPQRFFASLESVSKKSLKVTPHSSVTSYNIVSDDGESDLLTWTPDVSFGITTYSSDNDEYLRVILTEVKTGQYAELKENQKKVVGILNNKDNTLVLRANVFLTQENFVELQYSTLEQSSRTNTGYRLTPLTL